MYTQGGYVHPYIHRGAYQAIYPPGRLYHPIIPTREAISLLTHPGRLFSPFYIQGGYSLPFYTPREAYPALNPPREAYPALNPPRYTHHGTLSHPRYTHHGTLSPPCGTCLPYRHTRGYMPPYRHPRGIHTLGTLRVTPACCSSRVLFPPVVHPGCYSRC